MTSMDEMLAGITSWLFDVGDPACVGHPDPDIWYPFTDSELAAAQRICAGCPVREDCLAAALVRSEPDGVWGGVLLHKGMPGVLRKYRHREEAAQRQRKRDARAAEDRDDVNSGDTAA